MLRDWVSKLNRAREEHAKEGPPTERVTLGKKREVAKSSAQKARARAQDAGSKLKFLVGAAVEEEEEEEPVKADEEREEVESRNESFDRKKRARRKGTRDTKAAGENAGWFC